MVLGHRGEESHPAYNVSVVGEDGIIEPLVNKDGKVLLWRPDWNTSPTFKKMLEEGGEDKAEDPVQAAKQRREFLMGRQEITEELEAGIQSQREGF